MRLGRWKLSAACAAALLCLAGAASSAQAQGSVTGRVTASGTNEPLSGSRVMLVGTSKVAVSRADGRYTLENVPAGAAQVRVIRVGYQELKKPVTVASGQTITLDFSMTAAVVQLSEIVTTATGQQRRVELGNSVSTLGNVDQKVQTTAISNLADLMVAKAPGVVVLPGAMTGSAPVVHIRGLNSLQLNNDPIYVIDGVRMNSGTINLGTGGTRASFLNDIDPNDIEDVEIVKGPSAATLYGTDAANGVIVITTKRGRAGSTRYTWFGEQGTVDDRNAYPASYALWGHDTTPAQGQQRCVLVSVSDQSCIVDSMTSFNVLTDPSTTPFALGTHQNYGAQASGGSDQVRFYVSGNWQNEIGPIKMPGFAQQNLLDSLGTPMRDEWKYPEAFQNYGARANISASLSPSLDLTATAGYTNTNQRLPQTDNNTFSFIYSARNNPGFNHQGSTGLRYNEYVTQRDGSVVFRNGYGVYSPAQTFQVVNTHGTQRFIGSANANWRPLSWMANQGTLGIDLANSDRIQICRFGECPDAGTRRLGSVFQGHSNQRNFSAKVVSNSTWQARSDLIMTSTVGGDYTNEENDGVTGSGQQLPPGAQTVGDGAVQSAGNTLQTVDKTLGVYVQEQAAWRDRVFVTVAARSDQNSSFGENFNSIVYPKASVSWIVSDESFFPQFSWLNQFRLRSAYGASGVSPSGTVRLTTFSGNTTNIPGVAGDASGSDTPGLLASQLGNANLKPERSAEIEGGFETDVLDSRVHFGFTYYNKKTHDALINQLIAASSGSSDLSVLTNLASVENSGIEVDLNSTILDRREIGWDITVAASHNSNKLLSLGVDASGNPNLTIGTGNSRDSVGLPIHAGFAKPYSYTDANGDGIITPNEVTVSPDYAYIGYQVPRDIISITNGVDLFNRKLRITILTDNKGGGLINNATSRFYSSNFSSWYSNSVASTPLWDQARGVANSAAKNPNASEMGFFEPDHYWKLREVSAAWTMPNVVARRIRARDAQIVLSARNLRTWTHYTGPDPEENYGTGDVQTDFSTIAPPTYFLVKLNLHY
jgi:TonB-linked SusC/RagA family outer membrane protein